MARYVLYREEDFFPPKLPQIARCLIISINTELIKMKEVRGNVGLQNSFFFSLNVLFILFKMDSGELIQFILLKKKDENTMFSFITKIMTNN